MCRAQASSQSCTAAVTVCPTQTQDPVKGRCPSPGSLLVSRRTQQEEMLPLRKAQALQGQGPPTGGVCVGGWHHGGLHRPGPGHSCSQRCTGSVNIHRLKEATHASLTSGKLGCWAGAGYSCISPLLSLTQSMEVLKVGTSHTLRTLSKAWALPRGPTELGERQAPRQPSITELPPLRCSQSSSLEDTARDARGGLELWGKPIKQNSPVLPSIYPCSA